jgi:hypothetical protein
VLLKQISDRFVMAIQAFAKRKQVPMVTFEKRQRKEDIACEHMRRFKSEEGVVMIGVAQEQVSGFPLPPHQATTTASRGPDGRRTGMPPWYSFRRASLFVNQYYFYILDRDFGLCFIKFSSYAPFGVRVWLNGHEWAKSQLRKQGIDFEALDNGFLTCEDPEALQAICNSLGAEDIEAFFRKWLGRLPHPFSREDRRVNLRYQLSILQLEASLTQVLDRPIAGRQFFEEVIRDNLDLGRPDRVQLLFERRINRTTPGLFRTRVLTEGVTPSIRFDYKHTRVKQYFKLERALRTETTFNDTYDFEIGRGLRNLDRLRLLGRHVNHRILTLERVAQHCTIASQTVERIVLPTVDESQRAPALRWGDPRSMALFSALCGFIAAPEGFRNNTLRSRVGMLHDPGPKGYTPSRMSYDLRRLRLKGIIVRIPATNRYVLTPLGRRVSFFMTKSYVRVVRPILQRLEPDLPDDGTDKLRKAWRCCDHALDEAIARANVAN